VDFGHKVTNAASYIVGLELNFLEEIVCDLLTSLTRPGVEEIYLAAIDDSRELCDTFTHYVANWTHTNDHFEVFTDLQN